MFIELYRLVLYIRHYIKFLVGLGFGSQSQDVKVNVCVQNSYVHKHSYVLVTSYKRSCMYPVMSVQNYHQRISFGPADLLASVHDNKCSYNAIMPEDLVAARNFRITSTILGFHISVCQSKFALLFTFHM